MEKIITRYSADILTVHVVIQRMPFVLEVNSVSSCDCAVVLSAGADHRPDRNGIFPVFVIGENGNAILFSVDVD